MRLITIALAFVVLGLARIGETIEQSFDAALRWLTSAVSPQQPVLALEGFDGFLDPQPGNQPISAQLYNHNRHEALSHARAAYRAI